MIQELKKLCYHEDLNKLGTWRRILVGELLRFIISILSMDNDRWIIKNFEVIQEIVIREFHYE